MSTEYKVIFNTCEHCKRSESEVMCHSSFGWPIIFEPKFSTFKEWKKFLLQHEVIIEDEYGRTVSVGEFLSYVEEKQKDRKGYDLHLDHSYERIDEDGYRFFKTRTC